MYGNQAFLGNMRLFTILVFIAVSAEAKRRRTGKPRHKIPKQRSQLPGEYEYKRSDDPGVDKFRYPVPFGHIFKEGYEDPRSDVKQPLDLMELDTIYVKDGPKARKFIKNNPRNYQVVSLTERQKQLSAPDDKDVEEVRSPIDGGYRSAIEEGHESPIEGVHGSPIGNTKNESIKTYWNMEAILTRNLEQPPKYRIGGGQKPKQQLADVGPSYNDKSNFFAEKSYGLINGMEDMRILNFTTCNEFGKRAKFHPNDVVNIDWVPFYIWTYELNGRVAVSRVHHFSYPTKKFVKNFKEEFGSLLNKTLDWEQPKMLMKHGSMKLLLIAVDRSGLFHAIPHLNLPKEVKKNSESLKMPIMSIRLKIVDPYLALMYCDNQYAVIMAISGTEPSTPRKSVSEAAKLKFVGKGFPATRDFHVEAMEARVKSLMTMEKEQQKFITLEDQMEAEARSLIG